MTVDQRRQHLVDVAATVFLEKGYTAATVDEIARKSGISKKTVYLLFESKLTLFDAVIKRNLFDVATELPDETEDQQVALTWLIGEVARYALQPTQVALIRLIIAEGRSLPDFRHVVARIEAGHNVSILEQWLVRECAVGRLTLVDPAGASRVLFGMTIAGRLLGALMNEGTHFEMVEDRRTTEKLVASFLSMIKT